MIFVPTTLDKTHWDLNGKVLFLDKVYEMQLSDDEKRSIDYEILPPVIPRVTEKELSEFLAELIYIFTKEFNSHHKVDFPYEYWRKMLLYWLKKFAVATVEKIEKLESIDRNERGIFYTVTKKEELDIKFLLPYRTHSSEEYHSHLYGEIAHAFFSFSVTYYDDVPIDESASHREKCGMSDGIELVAIGFLKKILHATPKKICGVVFRYIKRLYRKIKAKEYSRVQCYATFFVGGADQRIYDMSGGEIGPLLIDDTSPVSSIDTRYRRFLSEKLSAHFSISERWKIIVAKLIPEYMPLYFIENYEILLKRSKVYLKRQRKLNLIYAPLCLGQTPSIFFILYAQQKGITVAAMQEGGNFGFAERGCTYREYAVVANLYYGWGRWTDNVYDSDAKFLTCPCHRFSYWYDKLLYDNRYILYVGSYVEVYHSFYADYRRGGESDLVYIERQLDFFSHISKTVREHMLIRNCYVDFGYHIDDIIHEKLPDVRIQGYYQKNYDSDFNPNERNSNFAETLAKCSLMIYDDVESPFVEALYCGKPLILLLDRERYKFREEEFPYVKLMESVGIIQYDTAEAAELLNNIYDHINEWWNETERQRVVEIIQKRYVTHCDDIDGWWCRELLSRSDELKWNHVLKRMSSP